MKMQSSLIEEIKFFCVAWVSFIRVCRLSYSLLATFAPGVARDFYYVRRISPTPGMLFDIGYPIYI